MRSAYVRAGEDRDVQKVATSDFERRSSVREAPRRPDCGLPQLVVDSFTRQDVGSIDQLLIMGSDQLFGVSTGSIFYLQWYFLQTCK